VGSGFHIEAPDSLAGRDYEFAAAAFGAPLPLRPLTAGVVYAQPGNACPPAGAADNWQLSNAAQIRGAIALIDRGVGPSNDCPYPGRYFARKVLAAQSAGALAVIVANDVVEPEPCSGLRCQLVAMGTTSGDLAETVSIPSVFVGKATGDALKTQGVRVTLSQPATALPLLEIGYPTNGAADANSLQYYSLWTGFALGEVSITVSAKFGNPDLYVSATKQLPNTAMYTWRSTNDGSDTLVLAADDPLQAANARYIVGVFANGASTAYTLTYSVASEAIALQSNVPLPAQRVDRGVYKYYTAWVDSDADAITIAVTVLQGDADLYVSFTHPKPTADSHTWEAVGKAECVTVDCGNTISNGDAVSIPRGDPNFCPNQGGGACIVHIGVYGARQSSFTALVTTSDAGTDTAVMLLDAQPIDAIIEQAGHYAYFNFNVPVGAKRVSFAIGAASDDSDGIIDGDPDLYVNYGKGPKEYWGPKPSRDKFVYFSSGDSDEALTITTADSVSCHPAVTEHCVYRLAVYAWKSPTCFSITALIKMERVTEEGDPLKEIERSSMVLQRDVRSKVSLEEADEDPLSFRFTLFWGPAEKAQLHKIKFLLAKDSAQPKLRWRLAAAATPRTVGGPPPPPPPPPPVWHDFDGLSAEVSLDGVPDEDHSSRDMYISVARAAGQEGKGAIKGSLRVAFAVKGAGAGAGGGAGGTVVLVLFLLTLLGVGGFYAYLVHQGMRDVQADAAALKVLAAAAAERLRAAAAAAGGAASGRGRVGDAATSHHMVAPLAVSSYAPPDEMPSLARLPDNLPPLGADGTVGSGSERPNAGLLTSAAV
jgi:hypothetical protein